MYGHPIQKMLELSNNRPILNLVKDIMRNVCLKSWFEFEPAFFFRGNVILKLFHFLALSDILLAKLNRLCYFGRGHYEEHFCEIIFNWTSVSDRDVI